MSPARDLPDRELKARQNQLYARDAPATGAAGPRKSFATYMKETPAAPLSNGWKAALIGAAVVVGLVFLASLFRGLSHRTPPPPRSSVSAKFRRINYSCETDAGYGWLQV